MPRGAGSSTVRVMLRMANCLYVSFCTIWMLQKAVKITVKTTTRKTVETTAAFLTKSGVSLRLLRYIQQGLGFLGPHDDRAD